MIYLALSLALCVALFGWYRAASKLRALRWWLQLPGVRAEVWRYKIRAATGRYQAPVPDLRRVQKADR